MEWKGSCRYIRTISTGSYSYGIKMPEMDGLEATRIIRKVSQEIPIIALTAFAFDDDRVKALEAGCNDYLTKPLSASLLKETIAKYLI